MNWKGKLIISSHNTSTKNNTLDDILCFFIFVIYKKEIDYNYILKD